MDQPSSTIPENSSVIGGVARPGSLLLIRNDARKLEFTNRGAKPVVVGDTDGISTWIAMTVWGAEYLGWNLRWIYGYPGSRELQLAIRQGEIDVWATQNAKLVKDLKREGSRRRSWSPKKTSGAKIFRMCPTFSSSWVRKSPRALPGRLT